MGIDLLNLHNITLDVTKKEMRLGTNDNVKIIKLNQLKKKTFPLYRVVDQPHSLLEISLDISLEKINYFATRLL